MCLDLVLCVREQLESGILYIGTPRPFLLLCMCNVLLLVLACSVVIMINSMISSISIVIIIIISSSSSSSSNYVNSVYTI